MNLGFRMIPTRNNKYVPIEISPIGLPEGTTDPKSFGVVQIVDSFQSWKFNLNFILSLQNVITLCCDVQEYHTSPGKEQPILLALTSYWNIHLLLSYKYVVLFIEDIL